MLSGLWLISGLVLDKFVQYDVTYTLPFSRHLINQTDKPISLYLGSDNGVVTQLLPGRSMPYLFQGRSGKWRYGKYKNKSLTAKNVNITFACLIEGYFVYEKALVLTYQYALYAALFIMLWFYMFAFIKRGCNKKPETEIYKELNASEYQVAEVEIEKYRNENNKLRTQNQQLERKLTNQQKAKTAEYHRILAELEKAESTVRDKNVELSILQESHDKLDCRFKEVIEEAKTYGIDYRNESYRRILMGRKYELRVAKSFYECGYRLLEWAPDKGNLQGFPAENNSNPDLIVSKDNRVYAIECKFRTHYLSKKLRLMRGEINWADTRNVNHYIKFSNQRKIKTYIALGFKQEPDNPEHEYLVSLERLLELSEKPREVSNWGEQRIVIFHKLKSFIVDNINYQTRLND